MRDRNREQVSYSGEGLGMETMLAVQVGVRRPMDYWVYQTKIPSSAR